MKSTRVYLIVILALALISTGVLAWRQHLELLLFRGTSGVAGKDVAGLEKRIWDAEQRARELEAKLAAQGGGADVVAQDATTAGGRQNAQNGRGGAQNQQQLQTAQRALQQVMQQPAYQTALAVQQKNQIDQQYAGLFRNLGLAGDQSASLSAALVARGTTQQDAAQAAMRAGLDPRTTEYQQFMSQAMSQSDDSIRGVVGDAGLQALQQYDQTMPQRTMVTQFQQQLVQYGSGALLTDAQSEQLVSLLAANNQGRGGARGAPTDTVAAGNFTFTAAAPGGFGGAGGAAVIAAFGGGGGRGGGGQQVSQAVINQASQILSPVQLQALQQMQSTQQAQQTIQQLTANAVRGAAAPTNGQQQGATGGGRGGATQGAAPQRNRGG